MSQAFPPGAYENVLFEELVDGVPNRRFLQVLDTDTAKLISVTGLARQLGSLGCVSDGLTAIGFDKALLLESELLC